MPAYGRRVAFVHQEIWQPGGMDKLAPTVEEWNLRSEPWTFVVDGDGVIRARFEGLTTRRELEAVLRQMLRPVAPQRACSRLRATTPLFTLNLAPPPRARD